MTILMSVGDVDLDSGTWALLGWPRMSYQRTLSEYELADGDYRIGLPETGVGIIPGAGGTQRMTRLLGTAKALELILHGRLLSPGEALGLGLVTEVVPQTQFEARVLEFAANLASRSPIGIAAAKEAIHRGADRTLEQGLLLEQALFRRCMESDDAATAMRAVLNGDSWEWRGR